MEVMQYLREEVDITKKEEVEEVIEEALLGRRSRRSTDAANGTTIQADDESCTHSNVEGAERCGGHRIVDVVALVTEMGPAGAVEDIDDNNEDRFIKSVYWDERERMWKCRHCTWKYQIGNHWVDHIHQKHFTFGSCRGALQEGSNVEKLPEVEAVNAKLKDVDIQKVLSAVISGKNVEILKETFSASSTLPLSTKPRDEDGTTSLGSVRAETEQLKIDIVDESDEEVLELEFERAVEKMHSHEYNMYCPNCSNRITKVVLRRRKREKRTQPQDLLGCLSCFSIFIPKGNMLNPFKIFGIGKGPEVSQPLPAPGSTVQQQQTPGDSILNEGRDPFWTSEKPTVNGNASSSQQSILPAASQPVKPNDNESVGSSGNANGAFALNDRIPTIGGSTSDGSLIIDIPDKLDKTTQGTGHPLKPIGEIVEGQNITNGQYPGPEVHFPSEGGSIPTEPPQIANVPDTRRPLIVKEEKSFNQLEILKSVVYGGLMELITSLSIVASAAASDATTLNIVAIGMANLVGGLVLLFHNLKDLRYDDSDETSGEGKNRYKELLGRKENFVIHMIFAVLSYLVFGLIPPVVYGFTFRETDDGDFKIVAVAACSLVCISILATAKAYTRGQHTFMAYSKTLLYYVTGAVTASGLAYAAGHLFERFMDSLGWFDTKPVEHLLIPENKSWSSF